MKQLKQQSSPVGYGDSKLVQGAPGNAFRNITCGVTEWHGLFRSLSRDEP